MSETKRRRNITGSKSIGTDMEMQDSPQSARSRKAWSWEGSGQDDVDGVNSGDSDAVDMPSAMEAEPYTLQTRVTRDVRADNFKNEPDDCFRRFKRAVRGKALENYT